MPHNFQESLAMSHEAEDLSIWPEIYRMAFPTMQCMLNHRQDGDHQRQGIDRSIILENSKQILIDEKVRGRNKKTGRVYEDIALEYWGDQGRKVRGWVCKPLLCDYIAYAIAPAGKCYLLPVQQLQQAWARHALEWTKKYFIIKAHNEANGRKWTTVSVGVPPSVLFVAIRQCLRIEFTATEICQESA